MANQIASELDGRTKLLANDRQVPVPPESLQGAVAAATVTSSPEYRAATEGLAGSIQASVASKVEEFGLEIHRVALQEVTLPPEIHQAALSACKAAYAPMQAHNEAIGTKLRLQAEADVLGADAIAAREVVGAAKGWAVQDFLGRWFNDFAQNRGGNRSGRKGSSK